MKRSKIIPLVVLGTLTLAGCEESVPTNEVRQNTYASVTDCQKDWGTEQDMCRQHTATNSSGHIYPYWAGPRYFWDHSLGHPVIQHSDGKTSPVYSGNFANTGVSSGNSRVSVVGHTSSGAVSRGGFGSSAHATSAGG